MPDDINVKDLEELPDKIEQTWQGQRQIAAKYEAKIAVCQIKATLAAKSSADRYSFILVVLTTAITALTVVLVVLTIQLLRPGG